MKLNKTDLRQILENAITWIVVFAMFAYGARKIVQFDGANQVDKPVADLTGMELMWAFYGYSHSFVIVIGILEILGGLLLFFKRTRLIGCFYTSGILLNIILQDIFYGVHFGALKAALIYQGILVVILYRHKEQVLQSIKKLLIPVSKFKILKEALLSFGLSLVLFVVLRITEYYVTIKW